MNSFLWILVAAAVAVVLAGLKRLTLIGRTTARDWLGKGAIVIDVRTEAEYRQGHLPGALNIPLDRLETQIDRFAPDRQKPLLLHCLSGGRSGMAQRTLRRLGYPNAFNLGSYARAARILASGPG